MINFFVNFHSMKQVTGAAKNDWQRPSHVPLHFPDPEYKWAVPSLLERLPTGQVYKLNERPGRTNEWHSSSLTLWIWSCFLMRRFFRKPAFPASVFLCNHFGLYSVRYCFPQNIYLSSSILSSPLPSVVGGKPWVEDMAMVCEQIELVFWDPFSNKFSFRVLTLLDRIIDFNCVNTQCAWLHLNRILMDTRFMIPQRLC